MDSQDRTRRAQEEIKELQEVRLRISAEVVEGKPGALEEDRCIRERIVELARLMEPGGCAIRDVN
jgi:hypothetical protein